ncbi:hypothetical protein [Sulfitobacter sp. R18_1]|uniref:hypothetical protein n=1 Tax=Sulfitobacter sp. R18_1 TaxID=2821104 RepID=UPI001ADC184E|nr:hypothetical protein [Sulfitobacter sp. R18_1]MBO9428577.1 hypothetical protein [Sulfitobacter sp. R18_1]
MKLSRVLTASILSIGLSAQAALSLCSAPQLERPDDLIIQLRSAVSGQTFIGSGSAIGTNSATARSEGAIYYDATAQSLVTCDGTDWVSVGAGTGGDSGSCENVDYKYYTVTKTGQWGDGERGDGGQTFTNYANIPASEQGSSEFTFSLDVSGYETNGYCYIDIQTAGGWKRIGQTYFKRETGGRGGEPGVNHPVRGDIRVVKNSDDTYSWSSAGNFDNLRSLNGPNGAWTGAVRVTPSTSNRCVLKIENVERMPGCH